MKYSNDEDNFEFKENKKLIFSKFDYELYNEEEAKIVHDLFRIKRTGKNNTEKWKFYKNAKLFFTLDSLSLAKKEKEFLYTHEGLSFLLQKLKSGIDNVTKLKKEIKLKIKDAVSDSVSKWRFGLDSK